MSYLTVRAELVRILTASIGGSPDLNADDGANALRRDLTTAEVHYGWGPEIAILQPFPCIHIEWNGTGLLPEMAAGQRQERTQRFTIWSVAAVNSYEKTEEPDTEGQILGAEKELAILSGNIVRVMMDYVQNSTYWELFTYGDISVRDMTSADGLWVKAASWPITLQMEFSTV